MRLSGKSLMIGEIVTGMKELSVQQSFPCHDMTLQYIFSMDNQDIRGDEWKTGKHLEKRQSTGRKKIENDILELENPAGPIPSTFPLKVYAGCQPFKRHLQKLVWIKPLQTCY